MIYRAVAFALAVWSAVYTVSYGSYLCKNSNIKGGVFIIGLCVLPALALFFVLF